MQVTAGMGYVQIFTKSNPPTQTSGKIQLNEDVAKHQDPHQVPQEPQEDQGHPSRMGKFRDPDLDQDPNQNPYQD